MKKHKKTNKAGDQSFDTLADKFEKNIYGSTKGQLRHELLVHHLENQLNLHDRALQVLDAGGGTGIMTEYFLNQGHNVTLSDISIDVLDIAKQKLAGANNLRVMQTDILSLDPAVRYDLVICHAVLEWVQNPQLLIVKLLKLVKPGGHLSLSFFNYDAQLFGNMLYGNFDYVEKGMPTKNIVRLSPSNPQRPKTILSDLMQLSLDIKHTAGIRCFHDYLKEPDKQINQYATLKQLEIEYGSQEPYKWLGKYFLIIAQKH
jgi:S-adenosylmethionine-dependent methyltransferase